MVISDEYTGDRDRRRGGTAIWEGPERRGRRISPAAGGQLLEEGHAPLGPVGTFGESNSEFTSQGGEGSEAERKATMGRKDNPDPTAQADGDDGDASTGGIPESTGERMGKGKTHKGPTGEGQIGRAQTAEGGERSRKSQPPGQK